MTNTDMLRSLTWAWVPIAAAAMSAVLIILLRPLLERYALARPNARSSHRSPTPQGGGIAVIAATIIMSVATIGFIGTAADAMLLSTVLGATAVVAAIGGADDLRPMGVPPRLLLEALAIAVALAAIPDGTRVVTQLPWWLERSCLLVGLLWFVNLVNFMDGIDWMTVAEIIPLSGAIAAFGLLGLVPLPVSSTLLALALLGAVIGFAPFNKPVAGLFLGDVGSLPIGLLLGWLLIQLAAAGALAAALLLPLYYVADASITLIRRMIAGEPFWQAHRSHFYQRARDHGLTVRAIVGRVFAINLALAGLACLTIAYRGGLVAALSLTCGAALVAWLLADFSRRKR